MRLPGSRVCGDPGSRMTPTDFLVGLNEQGGRVQGDGGVTVIPPSTASDLACEPFCTERVRLAWLV